MKTVKERNKLGSGPVIFKPPKNATEAEIEDMRKYVEGSNEALNAGYISSIGRVSTKGKLRRLLQMQQNKKEDGLIIKEHHIMAL